MARRLLLALSLATLPFVRGDPPLTQPDPSQAVVVSLNGQDFINKGMVGFGVFPPNLFDSKGDTIGGMGSAMAFKFGTWKKRGHRYTGTLSMHPDRGFNVQGTVDYQSRRFDIDFEFAPYYDTAPLSPADAKQTLQLSNLRAIFEFDKSQTPTTGFDPLAVRPAEAGFPASPLADPEMPIAATTYDHVSVDGEGIVSVKDGTYWISDEYGPYIYHLTGDGKLIQTIQPPRAILPISSGALNFTASKAPTTGRSANQGLEGLTYDPETDTLYALLQSGAVQDGSRFTRLLAYDIKDALTRRPTLKGEWVVKLPASGSGSTFGASEVHFVSENLFLALARDGNGRGGNSATSAYKQADLVDISLATDIHGTPFDDPANPIAVGGVLNPSITAAHYVPFVNYLNTTQLAKFGVHNGPPNDVTLIAGKWESLALAPVDDENYPHDYFLFTAADNDFLTTTGVMTGIPYNAGLDNDNQFFVFRLTLPTVRPGSIAKRIGA